MLDRMPPGRQRTWEGTYLEFAPAVRRPSCARRTIVLTIPRVGSYKRARLLLTPQRLRTCALEGRPRLRIAAACSRIPD